MDVLQVSRFFGILAFSAQAAVAAWLAITIGARRSTRLHRLRQRVLATVGNAAIWSAAAVALVATSGSLYYSEVAHFIPCELCWYQRIAMYPLVIVLGVAAARRDRTVRFVAYPVASIGLAISSYHYLIQRYPSLEAGSCSTQVPCNFAWIDVYGFVSIPYMAWAAFALIIVVLWSVGAASRMETAAASLTSEETG